MAKQRIINIQFPLGGLNERVSYQTQSPYSTSRCSNVFPFDVFARRLRGGSRPGLHKAYAQQLSDGAPVRLLTTATRPVSDNSRYWYDTFAYTDGELDDIWDTATPVSLYGGRPLVDESGYAYVEHVPDNAHLSQRYVVREDFEDFDHLKPHSIAIKIFPDIQYGSYRGRHTLFLRVGSTVPSVSSVAVTLFVVNDAFRLNILQRYQSQINFSVFVDLDDTDIASGGWLKAYLNVNAMKVFWREEEVWAANVSPMGGASTRRIGFGGYATSPGKVCIDAFNMQYYVTGNAIAGDERTIVVAGAGAKYYQPPDGDADANTSNLYRDAEDGLSITEVLTETDYTDITRVYSIQADRPLQAISRLGTLFIADHSQLRVEGSAGAVIQAGSDYRLTDDGVDDWRDYKIVEGRDVVTISDCQGGTDISGVYKVARVTETYVKLSPNPTNTIPTCAYRIEAAPKVYDTVTDELTMWDATDSDHPIPVGNPLIAAWNDRIVLAGYPTNCYYMSRQGDPNDWNFTQDTADWGRPIAGTPSQDGSLDDNIVALIPHLSDYLVYGCVRKMYIQRGDPAAGGAVEVLSRINGIRGPNAWCFGPDDTLVYLSGDGLMEIDAESARFSLPLSRDSLPNALRNVNRLRTSVSLAYSSDLEGILIFLTPNELRSRRHFYFHWSSKTFWPIVLSSDLEPTSLLAPDEPIGPNFDLLAGCRDGYIRRFDRTGFGDDGLDLNSEIWIGPILLGGNTYYDGILNELKVVLADSSDDITCEIHVGATHESSLASSAFAKMICTSGAAYSMRPNARGNTLFLKLSHAGGIPWAIERIVGITERVGESRVL